MQYDLLAQAEKRLKTLEKRLKKHSEIVTYQIINRGGIIIFSAELPLFVKGKKLY